MGTQNEQGAVTYDSLLLAVGEVMAKVVDLEVREESNEHGALFVTAIAGRQEKDYMLHEGTGNIGLLYGKRGSMKSLFQGTVTEMSIAARGDMYLISIHAKTFSSLMDIRKCNFSFQDIAMSSHEMIRFLLEPYPESGAIISIPDVPINRIYLQYQETTWDFLKRFLSSYGDCLYPDSATQGIKLRAGLQGQPEEADWDRLPYMLIRDMPPKDAEKALKGQVAYVVEAYEILTLGAHVQFRGKELYVKKICRQLKDGLLVNRYYLCFKEGMMRKQYYNPLISGISVNGAVKAVVRDRIRAQLETDVLTTFKEQYFYPYSTVAASSDGSGWYCMPKVGDSIRIFFPVSDEKEGYAISNIQGEQSPDPASPMGNPDLKDITTPDEKMVKFIENGILFSVSSGKGTITLTNDGKAEVRSDESIAVNAAEKIKIETEGELTLSAGTEIQMTSDQGCSVTITDDTVEANASIIKANI
ncbi:MAG: hypothetical protein HFG71_08135 [Hungatella sp.]|jgi:hypothetical protein|nr:hypothetical protein [Hungatella sp.]